MMNRKGPLRGAMEAAVANEFRVEQMIARTMLARLLKAGLTSTKADLGRFTKAIKAMLAGGGTTLAVPLSEKRLKKAGISHEKLRELISADGLAEEAQVYNEKLEKILPDAMAAAGRKIAAAYVLDVELRGLDALAERQKTHARFEKNLHAVWGDAIDRLHILVGVAGDIVQELDRWWRDHHRRKRSAKMALLHRLMARACRISEEIIVLLRAGLASGAHARWRSLHEVAVVANIVALNDDIVAERYAAHSAIARYDAMVVYKQHREVLGFPPLAAGVEESLLRAKQEVEAKFGRDFSAAYGWASGLLKKRANSFSDIEKLAGLIRLRPFYKDASQAVHASALGTLEPEGLPIGDGKNLAGPSNYGLAEPGRLAANSMGMITNAMFAAQPSAEAYAYFGVVEKLVVKCGRAFDRAEKTVEKFVRQDAKMSKKKEKKRRRARTVRAA
jgi:hypothetical protein